MSSAVAVTLTNRWASFTSHYPEEMAAVFSYRPPNYYFSPRYRAHVWDGKISLVKRRKMASGAFLEFKAEAEKQGIEFEIDDQRKRPAMRSVSRADAESDRGFQNECNTALVKHSNHGGLVLCATGTGKTRIAGLYFKQLKGYGVFVVDELTLLEQAKADIQKILGEPVGIIGDQRFNPKRITVATVQTLHRHKRDPGYREWQQKIDAMFIDEIHQQVNRRNIETVRAIQPKAVFGLTATVQFGQRPVRAKVTSLCGPVIYRYPLEQGTREGFLTPGICVGVDVHREEHPDAVDYQALYDLHVVRSRVRNDLIEELAREAVARGLFLIVFSQRIHHIKKLYKRLADLKTKVVYGDIDKWERVKIKKQFEQGRVQVIITNQVFKKGISINRVGAMIDAAGMTSKNDAVQKYGRGVRLCDGKKGLLYFDIGEVAFYPHSLTKATKSRRRALTKEGVKVFKIKWKGDAESVFDFAERKLKAVLRSRRRSS